MAPKAAATGQTTTPTRPPPASKAGKGKKATTSRKFRVIRVSVRGQVSRSYLALVATFPLRPLRKEAELDEAIAVLDRLQRRRRPLTPGEQDYLESLAYEVRRYEEEAHPMPPVSDAAMLRHLMDARDATQSDVASATGIALSTISAVLSGKRSLTRDHMEKLAPYFGVKAAVFMG